MAIPFATYMRFTDETAALEVVDVLREAVITLELEDSKNLFDPSFSNNPLNREIRLKLAPDDFDKANEALKTYYANLIHDLPKDYPLLQFTQSELLDVIQHPDEWGHLDYVLAKDLLNRQGIQISADEEAAIARQRNETLSKPASNGYAIVLGYLFAVLGGLLAVVIGLFLVSAFKTLPNGQKSYLFSKKNRFHGKMIIAIALFLIAIRFWFSTDDSLLYLLTPLL